MNMHQVLQTANANEAFLEEVSERLLDDMMGQLDVLDPVDDGSELLQLIVDACGSPEGRELVAFLLGMPEPEDWFDEITDLDE